MASVPFFAPGLVLWTVLAVLASPRVGRMLHASRLHALLLLLAFGLVLMATLPPTGAALAGAGSYQDHCDLDRIGLAPLSVLLRPNATSLNVVLFIPLGIALGSLPLLPGTALAVLASFGLPFAIELLQLSFPALGRGCESADIIDNTMGLVIGLTIGFAARWLFVRARAGSTRA